MLNVAVPPTVKLTVNASVAIPVRVKVYARFVAPFSATDEGDSDGGSWIDPTRTNQLAVYDLVAQTWMLQTLPFAVDQGSDMCLVNDTLYILASNYDPQPLKLMVFTTPITAPSAPRIMVQQVGGQALLTWPAPYSDFTLEEAASFPPQDWTPVASSTNQWLVPASGEGDLRFYRLRWP